MTTTGPETIWFCVLPDGVSTNARYAMVARERGLRTVAIVRTERNEAEEQANLAVIARIERLYEEFLDLRPMLQDWLLRFTAVIERQDRDLIARSRVDLQRALDEVEAGNR